MSSTHPLNALPLGHLLADGEFRVEQVLGVGGFGITYLATDRLGGPVAIKEYLPNDVAVRLPDATRVSARSDKDEPDFLWGLDKFQEEGRRLAVFDHPHINRVLRLFAANGTAYLVLEYVHGVTLSQRLGPRDGTLPAAQLRHLLEDLLSALQSVHAAGLVHCDLKPSNIMIRHSDGSGVLLDFGASRVAVKHHTRSALSAFTPPYAAVEQYETESPDLGPWTDLYGLGMVAYRAITGRPEADLPDAVRRAKWQRRGQQDPNLPPAATAGAGRYPAPLLKAVDRMLEVEEGLRPQSAQEVAAALYAGLGEHRSPEKPPQAQRRPAAPKMDSGGARAQARDPGTEPPQADNARRRSFRGRLRLLLCGALLSALASGVALGSQAWTDAAATQHLWIDAAAWPDWQVVLLLAAMAVVLLGGAASFIGLWLVRAWAPAWALGFTVASLLLAAWLPAIPMGGWPYSLICTSLMLCGAALAMSRSQAYEEASSSRRNAPG